MKRILVLIILINIALSFSNISPVYIALPASDYGVPAVEDVTFTARLMINESTYVDLDETAGVVYDELTNNSSSCGYFINSTGEVGIIKIECGNFVSDLSSSSIFDINFMGPDLTVYAHHPVLEVTFVVNDGFRSGDTIYLELDGGMESFSQGTSGDWEDGILPVTLSNFTASFNNGVPILQWITASENSNAGWNVYRGQQDSVEGSYQINPELIAGQGTTSEETTYIFEDEYEIEYGEEYYYWLESIAYNGESETYGPISLRIPDDGNNESPEVPIVYGLHENYPNPFNPCTRISFALKEQSDVKLDIYNLKGQKVINLLDNFVDKVDETISVTWNGKDQNDRPVGSGIYFYQLKTKTQTQIKKMTLIK